MVCGAPATPMRPVPVLDWQPAQVRGTITQRQLPLGLVK
jgi:hypothetical protein